MKKAKKIASLLLVLVMLFALAMPAMAADTTKVTIDSVKNHTFVGYKLMEVTTTTTTTTTTSNGYGYTVAAKYDALIEGVLVTMGKLNAGTEEKPNTSNMMVEAIRKLNAAEVRDFANAIYDAVRADSTTYPTDAEWVNTVDGKVVEKELEHGYWLIADTTDVSGKYDSASLVLLDTVWATPNGETIDLHAKVGSTEHDKTTYDVNDSTTVVDIDGIMNLEASDFVEKAVDYDIGDEIPFIITGRTSNKVSEYKYYSCKIVDQADPGLTFNPESFKVILNGEETPYAVGAKGTSNVKFWYEIDENNTLYVYPAFGYTDLSGVAKEASKENGGDFKKLYPENTDLNNLDSAPFEFRYTCTLNNRAVIGGDGNVNRQKIVVSNNPYADSLGETTEKKTTVYSFEFTVHKVNETKQPLEGADFELYKFVALSNAPQNQKPEGTDYVWHPGVNKWGKFVQIGVDSGLKITNGVADNPGTDADETVAATTFRFVGLDEGFYKLVETKVPSGYNSIEPIEFALYTTLEANSDGTTSVTRLWTAPKDKNHFELEGDTAAGVISTSLVNKTGQVLPSTGGVGTTMFYVLGAALMVGAVVLLVTKKRMSEN